MTAKGRSDQLTTVHLWNLDHACEVIKRAFGQTPYLVGTAGVGGRNDYRDVDVRLILDEAGFAEACPALPRWEALCLAFSTYLSERSGLRVDFQIQRRTEANAKHEGPRNPLGGGGPAFRGRRRRHARVGRRVTTFYSPARGLLVWLRGLWRQHRCAHAGWTPLDGCTSCGRE